MTYCYLSFNTQQGVADADRKKRVSRQVNYLEISVRKFAVKLTIL